MTKVIWNSLSPISRPSGASTGNSTVKPMPTLTREMSKVRFA